MITPCFYKPSQNGDAFMLSVSKSATVGPSNRKFLMGGVNTAIALEAAEKVCERSGGLREFAVSLLRIAW